MSQANMKPDCKVFNIRPLQPREGSSRNRRITNQNNGSSIIVDYADIPDLIADLEASYKAG